MTPCLDKAVLAHGGGGVGEVGTACGPALYSFPGRCSTHSQAQTSPPGRRLSQI